VRGKLYRPSRMFQTYLPNKIGKDTIHSAAHPNHESTHSSAPSRVCLRVKYWRLLGELAAGGWLRI